MATVIRQTAGHYEVEDVPYGKDYTWCPDCVMVLCDCGERVELTASQTNCGCGVDHATLVRDELDVRKGAGTASCLEEEHDRWMEDRDEYLRSEDDYRREFERLE